MTKKRRGKSVKRKTNSFVTMRECLNTIAELCGIAGFLLALYTFVKEYL